MKKLRTNSMAGFTLVEMLVAIVVAGILGAAVVQLFVLQNQAYIRQNSGVLASQNARAGFDMLVREMRNAGYDPRGLSGAKITNWSPDSLAWTADLNADGDTLDSGEAVLYYYQSGNKTLRRREGGSEGPVADGITSLVFEYFQDYSGAAATTEDEIGQIRVDMEFSTPRGVMDGQIATEVAIRNHIY
jgi:type IV pilus assembly protein PilW